MRATFLVALLFASALVPFASAAPESGSPSGGPGRTQWPPLPPGKEPVAAAFERGTTHFDRGEYDAALAAFRVALREGPDCWQAELGAGMALACLDRNAEAVTSLTKIVQSQKEESGARTYRAWAFEKLGEFDRAVSDFDVLLAASPDDTWCHASRGWCALQSGAADKALADFEAILERVPGDVMARIEKAEALVLKGDKAEAVKILAGIPPDIQLSPAVAAEKATALYLAGERAQGLSTMQALIDADPQRGDAWHILGWMLRCNRNVPASKAQLDALMAKHPGQPAAHYQRGLLRSGETWDPVPAAEDFEAAWKLAPDRFPQLFEWLLRDLPESPSGDKGWNGLRARILAEVALRTDRRIWARSWLEGKSGKLITGTDRAWLLMRLDVADRRFKEAVAILDEHFAEFPMDLTAIENSEPFRDFCASAEYHDWKFPAKK